MDGVPAPFDLLGTVSGLLNENNSRKAVIQIPEVHRGNPAFKIPDQQTSDVIRG